MSSSSRKFKPAVGSSLQKKHASHMPLDVLDIPDSPPQSKRPADLVLDLSHSAPSKRFKPALPRPPTDRGKSVASFRQWSADKGETSSTDSLNLGSGPSRCPTVPPKFPRKLPLFLPSPPRPPSPRKSSPSKPSSEHNDDLDSKSLDSLRSLLSTDEELHTTFGRIISDHFRKFKDCDIIILSRFTSQLEDRISTLKQRIACLDDPDPPSRCLPAPFPAPCSTIHPQPDTHTPPPSMPTSDTTLDTLIVTHVPDDLPMSIDSPEIEEVDLPDTSERTLVVGDSDDPYYDKFDPLPEDLVFFDPEPAQLPTPSATASAISVPATPAGRIDHTSSPYYKEVISILKNTFKLSTFRTNQLECIIATLNGKDVFYLAPTGGGKSLCFQLPALCNTGKTQGTTFVISPLISLITDQVAALRRKGVPAFPLTSAAEENEVRQAMRMMRSNVEEKPKLVYTTPERLQKSDCLKDVVDQLYAEKQLARFVIDEAHVIGSWGRDFRASYAELNVLRKNWPDVPIMALTGSANKDTIEDIKYNLAMRDPVCLAQSFNRPNLHYSVRKKPSLKKDLVQQIAGFIKTHHPGNTGIIYALSRAESEEMAQKLREEWGIEARHYHAGIDNAERKINQQDWMTGRCKVIVATIAFGMGIDKPDVRFVIHATLSKDMDGYYQETGRAGRDGRSSDCVLFYSYNDSVKIEKMLRNPNSNDPTRDKPSHAEIERQVSKLQGVVAYCCNESDCRRVLILRHFDEEFKPGDCHNQCDNCHRPGTLIHQDFTAEARQIIQLLQEMMEINTRGVTPVQLKDTWKGKNNRPVQLYKGLSLYAAGKALTQPTIERIFNHLITESVLSVYRQPSSHGYFNNYIQPGSAASDYIDGDKQLVLSWKENEEDTKLSAKKTNTKPSPRKKGKEQNPLPKPSYLNLYDDIEDPDDPDPSEAEVLQDVMDNADMSQPAKIPQASTSRLADDLDRLTVVQNDSVTTAPPEEDIPARLKRLRATRLEISQRFNKLPLETILQEDTLELLALMNPKDEDEFRNILMECEDLGEVHNKWNSYGALFLAALNELSRSSKSFDAAKLRRDFAFNG